MKDNFFLIHGSFGSPFANWLPWLRNELCNRGKEVYTPDLPTGTGFQNYDNWEKLLKAYVNAGLITQNTTIFAHSIAPVFVSKFLVENKISVKKLVFVCGFNNYLGINEEYDSVNRSMFFDNLAEVKKYCPNIICLYSENDPYVPYDAEKNFADTIATKQEIIKNGGHLNSESGYSEFPKLLEYI